MPLPSRTNGVSKRSGLATVKRVDVAKNSVEGWRIKQVRRAMSDWLIPGWNFRPKPRNKFLKEDYFSKTNLFGDISSGRISYN